MRRLRIGKQIWQNESNGTVAGLTAWNAGKLRFTWNWAFYLVPEACVARSKKAFQNCSRSCENVTGDSGVPISRPLAQELARRIFQRAQIQRKCGTATISRAHNRCAGAIHVARLPTIARQDARMKPRRQIAPLWSAQFARVASTSHGCYALVDYVNFKGEGVTYRTLSRRRLGITPSLEQMHGMKMAGAATNFRVPLLQCCARRVRIRHPNDTRHVGWGLAQSRSHYSGNS